jgi:hypothetical protein
VLVAIEESEEGEMNQVEMETTEAIRNIALGQLMEEARAVRKRTQHDNFCRCYICRFIDALDEYEKLTNAQK